MSTYFNTLLRAYDLLRRSDPRVRRYLLANFADWVEKGYVFVATRKGVVSAVAIAGPVSPETLNEKGPRITPADYSCDEIILHCHHAQVAKRWRGKEGRIMLGEMTAAAMRAFPQCTQLAFIRGLRNDNRLKRYALGGV